MVILYEAYPMNNANEALAKIARGDPAVVNALWRAFPSAIEVDLMDKKAARRLLKAVVDAASQPKVT